MIQLLTDFESKVIDDSNFLQNIHSCIEQESEVLYNDIFHDTSTDVGKHLSRVERNENGWHEVKSLIYGEVEYHSFYQVLRKINPNALTKLKLDNGDTVVCTKQAANAVNNNTNNPTTNPNPNPEPSPLIFYDLGSGTGKAVILARILYDFKCCNGIEILDGLYQQSKKIELRFNKTYNKNLTSGQSQDIKIYHGSILHPKNTNNTNNTKNQAKQANDTNNTNPQAIAKEWYLDGDIVFANSTCFDDDLMSEMSNLASNMKSGAIFVTFTKGLNNCCPIKNNDNDNDDDDDDERTAGYDFELLDKKRYKMSWGPATVFIHRKLYNNELGGGRVRDGYNLSILPCDNEDYDNDVDNDVDNNSDSSDSEDDYSNNGNNGNKYKYNNNNNSNINNDDDSVSLDSDIRDFHQQQQTLYGLGVDRLTHRHSGNGTNTNNGNTSDSDSNSDYIPSDQTSTTTTTTSNTTSTTSNEERIFNNYDEMQQYYNQLEAEEGSDGGSDSDSGDGDVEFQKEYEKYQKYEQYNKYQQERQNNDNNSDSSDNSESESQYESSVGGSDNYKDTDSNSTNTNTSNTSNTDYDSDEDLDDEDYITITNNLLI